MCDTPKNKSKRSPKILAKTIGIFSPIKLRNRSVSRNRETERFKAIIENIGEQQERINNYIASTSSSVPSATTSKMPNLQFRDLITMIKPYDGSRENYKFFVSDCERVFGLATENNIDHKLVLNYIVSIVGSLGCDFVVCHSLATWEELKKICDQQFKSKMDEATILYKMTTLTQGTLSVFPFYSKFASLIHEYDALMKIEYAGNPSMHKLAMERANQIIM